MEFRAQEGHDPDIDHVDGDADKLKQIAGEMLKSLGISEYFLDMDFTAYVSIAHEFNCHWLIVFAVGFIYKIW